MATSPVTVLGGTGNSGSAVAAALIAAGVPTRVVTRSREGAAAQRLAAAGCEIVTADQFDRAGLTQALKGSGTVYLAGASKADQWNSGEAAQGMNAIDAALAAGVTHFIYQSALVEDAHGVLGNGSKRAIEERLAELDLVATVLRPAIFMDNLLTHSRPRRNEAGRLTVAMALPVDLPRGYVSVHDIGRAAAAVVADAERLAGRTYDLVADDVSLAEMAAILTELLGEPVDAVSVPVEAIAKVSPPVAAVYRWLTSRAGGESSADLRALVGEPLTFREWAKHHLAPALTA